MAELIKLIDLPGVREIEAALHIPGRQIIPEFADLQERIDELSKRLFGLTAEDTEFEHRNPLSWDNTLDRELWHTTDEWHEWESNFQFEPWYGEPDDGSDEAEDQEDEEEDEDYWTASGWDVCHDNGEPLLLLPYLERQLICVIEGLLPEAQLNLNGERNLEREAQDWGRQIEEEARRFKAKRS